MVFLFLFLATFTYVNLSTHWPTMGPNSAVEADSRTPYIAAKSKESGQTFIMYKPTENSHILQNGEIQTDSIPDCSTNYLQYKEKKNLVILCA